MRISHNIGKLTVVSVMAGLLATAGPALSAEFRVGSLSSSMAASSDSEISSTLTVFAVESIAMGYLTPASGSLAFGALPGEPLLINSLNGGSGGVVLADTFDIVGTYTADLHGGRVGLYGGYSDRPTTLSLEPDSAWSFGASIGYAGFYVRGGISDMNAAALLQSVEG